LKHISAHLGKPQAEYKKRFAWVPTKVSQEWIWLDSYYQKTIQWQIPSQSKLDRIIAHKQNISKFDFILEGFQTKKS
jgi:hypothetical protein